MTGRLLERVAALCGVAGAVLLLAPSMRFAWLAVRGATASPAAAPATSAPQPEPPPPSAEPSAAPAARSAATPAGAPVRMSLVVDSVHGRAQVFVDGVPVGDTPFLGDVSCRGGKPVKIDIMPAKRVPITREVECTKGARRVTDAE
ncbi:MAG: hypothetical protein IT376_18345 [Polyangiaceae bacterium]|nr:hypothetical protein [Polyangiaceae bacterium]